MDGKSAIVTGSSSGIGRAITERLLADGWQVHGLDVAPASIRADAFIAHGIDLTQADATRALISQLVAGGSPGAFVHCAGVTRLSPLGTLKDEDGLLLWQLHVDACTRLANRVIPAMQAAGAGRVVLIGSRSSIGMAGRSQYAACKAALVALARSWAAEAVADGVTVNVVSPAATLTPMLQDPARAATSPRMPPIGRFIEPREVAALVAYLLSEDAAAITGQDIAICGGATLHR